MDTEERLKALENELQAIKEELKGIIMDIRTFLMEVHNPLRGDLNAGRLITKVIQEGGN